VRRLLRFVAAMVAGVALVAVATVTVPMMGRDIYRHAATTVAEPIPPLSTVTEEGSTVYAADGSVLAKLQPVQTRKPVKLWAISKILIKAVLDTEDRRFYQHGGIDFPSTIRAFLSDSSGGDFQGGSTITQQLVKQVYLTSARKLSRKVREAVIANRLEKLYTKRQILNAYLNIIYLGSGSYGVEAAAEAYWGVRARRVTLPEAALLAGLIQAPSGYDPIADPAAARTRRGQVLTRMLHYHDITRAQYRRANAAPLPTSVTTEQQPLKGLDAYYVAQVESVLLGPGSPLGSTPAQRSAALLGGGLQIYTNLSPTAQAQAEAAVLAETPPDATSQGIEENLVSIQPTTGAVTALIGGQNYQTQQKDPATSASFQAGSGFKIFTLLAALEHGESVNDEVDASAPCSVPFPQNLGYTEGHSPGPANNDEGDGAQGITTVLNATAQSLNCAYFRMAHQVGLPAVVSEAEELGIPKSEIGSYVEDPSIVLGTADVSPLQMAGAYATLASGGVYHRPSFVNHIVDRLGDMIYTQPTKGVQAVPTNIVDEADAAFEAVVQNGTGRVAQIPGREVAGKTGTTSGPTSAWFNGYTPQLETTVWMGNPHGGIPSMVVDGEEVYGATFPAPTVHDYMVAALANQPVEAFPPLDPLTLPPTTCVPEDTLTNQTTVLGANCALAAPKTKTKTKTTLPGSSTTSTAPTTGSTTPSTVPVATTTPATTPVTTPATTPPTS
jgi:membrane peptidoglycan carboxypeptidase